jgi:hypothetical protein
MLKNGVKTLVLYLEDWQRRMIKDFLHIDCDKYEVTIDGFPAQHKYGVPTNEELKRMYFTDWQIREMRDETGVSCEFIELHKKFISRYGVPPQN